MKTTPDERAMRPLKPLPTLIFASRWLQLPLYLGLIVALAIAWTDRILPAAPGTNGRHA